MAMTSSRPYILRALYEWILDNACTPYIVVNAYGPGVEVPQEHVKDGQIILNIAPAAVQGLQIKEEAIEFSGRFAGIPMPVYVPVSSVMGIYARENGQGMVFEPEKPQPPSPPQGGGDRPARKSEAEKPATRPSLRVVK
ncbi:MAG: ClpXP protease specificity-enhancing factor [Pseudomonadales bacterium]|nr:ClpXP protease specificity-enhancing factor [Pseudomonadales bacterium]MCP5345099.1 ClpXP protease specificity-enhancing factor [Pseudomonadales bacterium]